jgi:DNA-binding GntR family transcriptional regulator
MIKDRRLKGGEVIVEQRLADELGISRTPLREALQRLEGEGLVVKTANRSFVVRHVELKEYLHSLKVREVLEAEAASLAAGHVDPDALAAIRAESLAVERTEPYDTHAHWAADDLVHNLFIDSCGNAVMADILRHLRATTRLFEIARLADRLGPDSREHMAILDALQAGDAKASRRAVAAHIRSLFRFAVETIR